MHFTVTSPGNNSTCGDLFFSVPGEDALRAGAEQVERLCRGALPQGKAYRQRLEEELQRMKDTGTAYHFLMLEQIHRLSSGNMMLYGDGAGSLISYLLGLSAVDPLDPRLTAAHLSTPVEFVWGLPECTRKPSFSLGIDPKLRPLIHSRLDQCFGLVKTDDDLYYRISMADQPMPDLPDTPPEYTEQTCLMVLKDVAKAWSRHLKELLEKHHIEEGVYQNALNLAQEMGMMKACDLPGLIRLYAYTRGTFDGKRRAEDLGDPWFFATREEFYRALLSLGMPAAAALDFVKYGVWSQGNKRERYVNLLEAYEAPAPLMEYFASVHNLWSAAPIRSRLDFRLRMMEM